MRETRSDNWLADVAILNESALFSEPGDVSIYRNIADMCGELEHWFVEENLGHALTGTGYRIKLTTDEEKVCGDVLDTKEQHTEILKLWLRSAASAVRETRLHKATKRGLLSFGSTYIGPAEREGRLPDSIEGLIAYISMG